MFMLRVSCGGLEDVDGRRMNASIHAEFTLGEVLTAQLTNSA